MVYQLLISGLVTYISFDTHFSRKSEIFENLP